MNARSLALTALIGTGIHGVTVGVMHLLRSDHDPFVTFMSEYAIGPYAWVAKTGALTNVFSQPAAYPAGLYHRVFFVGSWLWLIVLCIGLLQEQFTEVTKGEPEAAH